VTDRERPQLGALFGVLAEHDAQCVVTGFVAALVHGVPASRVGVGDTGGGGARPEAVIASGAMEPANGRGPRPEGGR
jgi:hypothetical protein